MLIFTYIIGDVFALENLDFILVIPPKRGENELFTDDQFNKLYDHVTAFSLMTYDYSNAEMPGIPKCAFKNCIL